MAARRAHTRSLTQADMVLVSLFRAAGGSTSKVPYEEIVLQVWRDFPHAFSLRNHPEHPDASDVHKRLYQSLKLRGLALSLGNKVFRLTDKGVAQASKIDAQLAGGPSATRAGGIRLGRGEKSFLDHALKSRAYTIWTAGDKTKLIEYDARVFFQISTATPVGERRRKLETAMQAIENAGTAGIEEAQTLKELVTYLAQGFKQLFEERTI